MSAEGMLSLFDDSNFAHSISSQLNQKQIPISLIIPSINPPFSQQPIKNLIFLIT